MDQAVSFFGVDKSFPVTAFEPYIKSFIKEHADCILWYDYVNEIHPAVHKYLTTLSSICQNMVNTILSHKIYIFRLIRL